MAELQWIEQGMPGPKEVGTTAVEGLRPNLVFLDPLPSSKVAALWRLNTEADLRAANYIP